MAGLDAVSALSRGRGAPDGRPQPGAGPVLLLPAQQVRQRPHGVREVSGEGARSAVIRSGPRHQAES